MSADCYYRTVPYARCDYYHYEFRRNIVTDDHIWTVERLDSIRFRVVIDSTVIHVSQFDHWPGDNNTANVGIETNNPGGYIQGQYSMSLKYRNGAGWFNWSGRDGCHTDSNIGGHWDYDTEWHTGLNSGVWDSPSCTSG